MIVVEATVLAGFLAGEEELKRAAEELMRQDPERISGSLWSYELGNVLWKKVRYGREDKSHHAQCLDEAESLLVETVEALDRRAIWEIAIATGLTFYDASYVCLAG